MEKLKNISIKKSLLMVAMILGIVVVPVKAQTRISGFVRDSQSGEILIGANVVESGKR
jgi:hypothetical protein